jgi:hypothetical protein
MIVLPPRAPRTCLALFLVLVLGSTSRASFHLWHIHEVFSTADGSVQFIEMHNDSSGENFINGFSLTSSTHTFPFTANLPGDTAGKSLTLGTSNLSSFGFTPDLTIPANFFNPAGDTLNYAFGTSIFTFGAGQLPTDGSHSLGEGLVVQSANPANYPGQSINLVVPEPATAGATVAALGAIVLNRQRRRPA